jgi:periodic tryptophan protein 2
MKTSYQFANLLGSVYSGGNVVFTPDGQSILSPVGNRLSVFHLTRNTSTTLPFQTRKPIARLALNPADPNIVLVADEDGRALLVDISRRTVIASINFKKALRAARFSNDGRYIAVSHGSHVQVWKIPRGGARQFNPFELYRVYTGHFDDVLWIEWSKDSR